MVQIRAGQLSVTGNYRENNEDSCMMDDQQRIFVVADGMGGQRAGEFASAMAIEFIPKVLRGTLNFDSATARDVEQALDKAISSANAEIIARSEADPAMKNMGTTAVIMVQVSGKFYVVGVGDSRVYRLSGDRLEQLTTDHSITQALLDSGTITAEDAQNHRYRNVLYRYLGCRDGAAAADVRELQPQAGDRILLCSDGLNDGLKDPQILALLKAAPDPDTAVRTLVDAALEAGSRDNVTAMVIFVD